MRKYLLAALLCGLACASASPDTEWAAVLAMDAGPSRKPATREEAQILARAHLAKQKQLIEVFLAQHPADPRAFDARLRLAAILAATGTMDHVPQQIDEAMRILAALEKSPDAPAEKRADAGFRRVSLFLQGLIGRQTEMRDSIVTAARNFVEKYPGDKRGPRLLVEAGTVCDNDPALKRKLLNEARALSTEEELNRRIADDLVRLNHLDKPLELKFSTIQGAGFDTREQVGNVVVIVFWSAESPHCLMWMQHFRSALEKLPKAGVQIVTVSLDTSSQELSRRLKEFQIEAWPTNFDGKGWDNSIARPLGINALPTVFILDKSGVVRALNARDDYGFWITKLLKD
jgi:thiol-disulfide isomerase/thioredoxin